MNKTAAIRSQARRAVLVKAAIDPTQIAGALAMAGGGALGGSAVTDDDQSMLKRIGKGTLGAALGYGGYKLMTDPRWQQGLRNGVGTARNLIAGLLGKAQGAAKAAEAQPTPEEQAFAAGFCKAAEAMGVDPAALAKVADGVSDWVSANLPDYTPQERLVQELKAKKDRGIDIEKYRTSNVGNWAGILGSATAGTLGVPVVFTAMDNMGAGNEKAKHWIRHVRKLAPTFSARHPGVAKAVGRLAHTGSLAGKLGLVASPILGALLAGAHFGRRRMINKAIDQAQGQRQ